MLKYNYICLAVTTLIGLIVGPGQQEKTGSWEGERNRKRRMERNSEKEDDSETDRESDRHTQKRK